MLSALFFIGFIVLERFVNAKEIAHKMNITPRAIDGYRDSLFDKLEVKSRVGLAIYAVKNGIVTF